MFYVDLHFPVPELFWSYLNFLGIPPAQMGLNGWRVMVVTYARAILYVISLTPRILHSLVGFNVTSNHTYFMYFPACFGNLNDDIRGWSRNWFYASVGYSHFNLRGLLIVRYFWVPLKHRDMKLTAEEQIISERFFGLSVVPLGSNLTDDMVRRSGLYTMNKTERALLTARQAVEIDACAVVDEVIIDWKVGYNVTNLDPPIRTATDPSRKRNVARSVSPSKRLFLSFGRVPKKKWIFDFVRRTTLYSNSMDKDPSREDRCSL